jgi:hypothetical protein
MMELGQQPYYRADLWVFSAVANNIYKGEELSAEPTDYLRIAIHLEVASVAASARDLLRGSLWGAVAEEELE